LSHSFSPAYFKKKFAALHIDALYESFPIADINDLPALLDTHPDIEGLSVTIPYKETVIPLLDAVDDTAAQVGAVNCISIKNGRKKGYNTDIIGFEQSLVPLLTPRHTHALIMGTGGASAAVAYVLAQLGIPFQKVSRTEKSDCIAYGQLTADIVSSHRLIINTTPVGMYPHADAAPPMPYSSITDQHLLYDLIYNPEETLFLKRGKENGAVIKNGFEMLQLQAEASWDIWMNANR